MKKLLIMLFMAGFINNTQPNGWGQNKPWKAEKWASQTQPDADSQLTAEELALLPYGQSKKNPQKLRDLPGGWQDTIREFRQKKSVVTKPIDPSRITGIPVPSAKPASLPASERLTDSEIKLLTDVLKDMKFSDLPKNLQEMLRGTQASAEVKQRAASASIIPASSTSSASSVSAAPAVSSSRLAPSASLSTSEAEEQVEGQPS